MQEPRGGPDKEETAGLTVEFLLKHRVSLHASITLEVNLDALIISYVQVLG